jgi:hypothetical protein
LSAFVLEGWDVALVAVVSAQVCAIAYIRQAKWKALVLSLPIPFTVAVMSLGRLVDATNVVGMLLLLLYTHAVRLLHQDMRLPIVPSIASGAFGYCVVGGLLARSLPTTDRAFYAASGIAFLLALALYLSTPNRNEPGHRSPMPIWIKLPVVVLIVLGLVAVKRVLGGFMTMFPMVGVLGAYEARHSLRTISGQIPLLMIAMVPFMITCRLLQKAAGLGTSLIVAWVVFAAILIPFTWHTWRIGALNDAE